MEIELCENQQQWDTWLSEQNHREFLQSWGWGVFQQSTGKEMLRLQVKENGVVSTQVQGIIHKLPLGMSYVYIPRMQNQRADITDTVLTYIKSLGYVFARVEPWNPALPMTSKHKVTHHRQPSRTLLLDLQKSEQDLLAQMHQKTRYNIRLAEKKGVVIREGKDSRIFLDLNQETAERDAFRTHDHTYYETMLRSPLCHQLTAWYQDMPIASHIYVAFGGRCTYLHGASANIHRQVMAPYLLQWRGIQLAKQFGNTEYDFWGIAPESTEGTVETSFHGLSWRADHPLTGVTRYKAGFGGNPHSYASVVDVVFSPFKYILYTMARQWMT